MPTDVLTLSRIQFAMTIMFHYLFPPLSIGLGLLLVLMEGAYLRTKKPVYHVMTKFWTRIFAVNFAMGVATGLVMEFQFGTNWAAFSRYVGDVFGSALAAEGIFAFFLESGFLAVLVFGWDRVSPPVHFFATIMVFLGSVFSAVWIVIANSWMQTPAGYELASERVGDQVVTRAVITDFWTMVFNPSSMPRLAHVLLGAFILGAFFVMSISAYYLLRRKHEEVGRAAFPIALGVGLLCSFLMPFSGHTQAVVVANLQPPKLAAFEGMFETDPESADLTIFGIPDEKAGKLHAAIKIPGGLSWLIRGDTQARIPGLDLFRPEDRPPVALPFWMYRLMVGLGLFQLALALVGAVLLSLGKLFQSRRLLWVFVFAVVGPFIANQAGWIAAEVGRQPFLVYSPAVRQAADQYRMAGGLRTSQGISNTRVVDSGQVMASIAMFSTIYVLLFLVWVSVLHAKITHGPDSTDQAVPSHTEGAGVVEAARRRGRGLTTSGEDAKGS
jgi:cytochrome d ubiquinol oxidase subunit I